MRRQYLLALFLLIPLAGSLGQSAWNPDVGVQTNLGWGSTGAAAQFGATAYVPAISTDFQASVAPGAISCSADWLNWGGVFGTSSLHWMAGPGLYLATGNGDGNSAVGLGLRAVAGLWYPITPQWQCFGAVAPSWGLSWSRSEVNGLGEAGWEFGVRYVFASH